MINIVGSRWPAVSSMYLRPAVLIAWRSGRRQEEYQQLPLLAFDFQLRCALQLPLQPDSGNHAGCAGGKSYLLFRGVLCCVGDPAFVLLLACAVRVRMPDMDSKGTLRRSECMQQASLAFPETVS